MSNTVTLPRFNTMTLQEAAGWFRSNEAAPHLDEPVREGCARVAAWLEELVEAREALEGAQLALAKHRWHVGTERREAK